MFIFFLILLFVVIPTAIFDPDINDRCSSETNESECCYNYFNATMSGVVVLDLVQGTGWMERTLFFYGYYPNIVFTYKSFHYNLPLAYILIIIVAFFFSLMVIVRSASRDFKDRLVENEGQFYQYCNTIFGGWDFCIQNAKSAEMKSKAIYNELVGRLDTEKLREERRNRTTKERVKLITIRITVNLLVIAVLAVCGGAIYYIFNLSASHRNENDLIGLLYEFLPSLTIVCMNIIVPFIFKFVVIFERYSPMFIVQITLFRTILLRLSSLIVLYATLYTVVSSELGENETCTSSDRETPLLCWESFVGQNIYRLALTDFATHVVLTFFVNFPRALIERNSNSKIAKLIGEQDFDLPKHVLDIVYIQTLCWLGTFYAPLLPVMFIIIFFLMFYIKKFACLVNSKPGNVIHRASRSNSMFMTVLLVSYIVALLPVAYSVAEIRPSPSCGPFWNLPTVWHVIEVTFKGTPAFVRELTSFMTTAFFIIPFFIVLLLLIYYYVAVNSANRHMVLVLKEQLVLEGHDKQFLLERVNMFISQQQEMQKQLRRAEMAHEGERNALSN